MKTLITITGKSCSGKSTLESDLTRENGYAKAISHTTRAPRSGEVDGVSYYFISKHEFSVRAERGEFVETNSFNGNGYAMSLVELNRCAESGKPVVLVVDPNGHAQIETWMKINMKEGWRHISLYLIIENSLQAERFLRRSIPDLISGDDQILSVANRLCAMMHIEKDWDQCIHRTDTFFVLSYHEGTSKTIIRAVEQLVHEDYFTPA